MLEKRIVGKIKYYKVKKVLQKKGRCSLRGDDILLPGGHVASFYPSFCEVEDECLDCVPPRLVLSSIICEGVRLPLSREGTCGDTIRFSFRSRTR